MKYVIHITPSLQNLKSILKDEHLRLKYCQEDFTIGTKSVSRAAHPMVSFSEFNVDELANKKITYGKYAIAFNRSWVEKHRIHPVLYIDKNSLIADSLANLLVARRKNANNELAPKVKLSIMNIKCFTKNAIGYNSYINEKNFNFKNENEWRFVPIKRKIGDNLISQNRSTYLSKKDYFNRKLLKYPLKFKLKDVDYIFVEKSEQIDELSDLFRIPKSKIKISQWSN